MLDVRPISTPLGEILVWTDAEARLVRLELPASGAAAERLRRSAEPEARLSTSTGERVAEQIGAYFERRLRRFELPLSPDGTAFQLTVWDELRQIEYGTTVSYGELARRLGSPGASRAVGGANSRNPIPLVIPCHRVIAADGSIGGYSSGLDHKRALLKIEEALPPSLF